MLVSIGQVVMNINDFLKCLRTLHHVFTTSIDNRYHQCKHFGVADERMLFKEWLCSRLDFHPTNKLIKKNPTVKLTQIMLEKGPWSCGCMEHSGQGGQNLMTLNKCHLLYRHHLFNW